MSNSLRTLPAWARHSAVVAAAVLLGLATWSASRAANPAPGPGAANAANAPKAALTVQVVQAQKRELAIQLVANGNVAAWQEASVGAQVNGLRIATLDAEVGQSVQRGQLLATFNAQTVQAEVALARAGWQEAQALLAEAKLNAERARALQGSGALSAQQISQYLTQEQTAQARSESAKAQWDLQLLQLQHTELRAPDSGIVSARSATVGAVVGPGTDLFKLIRQGRLEWRAEVTAPELSRVSVGTPVLLTAPDGTQAKGRVRMLAPTVDPLTRNALVMVDLLPGAAGGSGAGLHQHFKPGMYARGTLLLGNSNALTLPLSAVLLRDGFSYVMRLDANNRVSQHKVETGRQLGTFIEVRSGIAPQDRVVANGGGFLSDGDTVRVVPTPGAGTAPTSAAPASSPATPAPASAAKAARPAAPSAAAAKP